MQVRPVSPENYPKVVELLCASFHDYPVMRFVCQTTGADRERIAERCRNCDESQIVITHGTDTMVETAAVLASLVPGKSIVLTGAMVPYAFGSSDGLFNLGSALSFAQSLPHGVYIAMNGQCFSWNNVRKNKQRGEFEAIN